MIKKMMSYVLGMIFVAVAFVAVFATASSSQKVYASSITDPLVLTLNSEIVGQNVKLTAKIQTNTGINGVQLNLNADNNVFSATATGYSLSALEYVQPLEGYQGVSLWRTSDGENVTKTGKILVLTLTLKSTAKDGTYTVKFSPIACYNDGISTQAQNKKVAIQSAKITVENGKIAGAESFDETTGLPAWAIVLIAVGGVAVVGGITTWVVLSKRKQPKTWKQVK